MSGDPGSHDAPSPPPPRKGPGDYKPDLRPMLILAGLLVVVLVGWIVLNGLILPPR
jgi:hypothetical protein